MTNSNLKNSTKPLNSVSHSTTDGLNAPLFTSEILITISVNVSCSLDSPKAHQIINLTVTELSVYGFVLTTVTQEFISPLMTQRAPKEELIFPLISVISMAHGTSSISPIVMKKRRPACTSNSDFQAMTPTMTLRTSTISTPPVISNSFSVKIVSTTQLSVAISV